MYIFGFAGGFPSRKADFFRFTPIFPHRAPAPSSRVRSTPPISAFVLCYGCGSRPRYALSAYIEVFCAVSGSGFCICRSVRPAPKGLHRPTAGVNDGYGYLAPPDRGGDRRLWLSCTARSRKHEAWVPPNLRSRTARRSLRQAASFPR